MAPVAMAKDEALAPETATEEIWSGALPRLRSSKDLAALVVPVIWAPKA